MSDMIFRLVTLPFSVSGQCLRALSLSGGLGNAAAVLLYVLLCLSPLLLMGKRDPRKENILLVLASGVMFYVMYWMVNPFKIPSTLGEEMGKVIGAGAVYSVLITWGVLRLLRAGDSVVEHNAYGALRIFLLICGVECVLSCGLSLARIPEKIQQIQSANTMPGLDLTATYVFTALSSLAIAMEYGLDAGVLWMGSRLLRELGEDPYSESCGAAARKTVGCCKNALTAILLASLALNLGQLIFAGSLHNMDMTVRIPVVSLAIVFLTLAITRLLSQGKALKEDNDLFI